MENSHFEKIIYRDGSYSAKWQKKDQLREKIYDFIPLSVADMDLAAPEGIITAIEKINRCGIYGYTLLSDNWNQVVAEWMQRHYQLHIDPLWNVFCPRVIQAVALFLQYFTQPGDGIAQFSPSYGPISQIVTHNQRQLNNCQLHYHDGQYEIDFIELEKQLAISRCFILLSPHNPTGIVWKPQQLRRIVELCQKHHVFIISDDVHADFVFSTTPYTPISKISDYAQNNSMICTSPAKTFNLAGLEIANIIIANPQIRERFCQALYNAGIHNPGYFSVAPFLVAYQESDGWLKRLKAHLAHNRNLCQQRLKALPELQITQSEGTYLLWIDFRSLKISEAQLAQWFNDINIEVSLGSHFGQAGEGFFRINIALPTTTLKRALERIISTVPRNNKEQ